MHDDLDPLSQLEIENIIRGLMREASDNTQEVARCATRHASASSAYKVAYAKAFLRAEGAMDLRRQVATEECCALLAEHEIAESLLLSSRLAGENIRARLNAAQSLNRNISSAVANSSGFGG